LGNIALVIAHQDEKPVLLNVISDEKEIEILDAAVRAGEKDPLQIVMAFRQQQEGEDEEFGEYVEEILSQPFVKPELQQHGVQWLKSKMKIEYFQKKEADAAKIIAEYAFKLYTENPGKLDFIISGPTAAVRIRVFLVQPEAAKSAA
jgi:hypothetical protein